MTDYSQVDMLGVRYQFVNFSAGMYRLVGARGHVKVMTETRELQKKIEETRELLECTVWSAPWAAGRFVSENLSGHSYTVGQIVGCYGTLELGGLRNPYRLVSARGVVKVGERKLLRPERFGGHRDPGLRKAGVFRKCVDEGRCVHELR